MNESKTTRDGRNCEHDVIGVTELNGDANATLNGLTTALRDALYALRARQATESIGDERGVVCPRCGARAYPERAEHGLWILVNSDGSPHSDACPLAEGQAEVIVHPLWPFDPLAT